MRGSTVVAIFIVDVEESPLCFTDNSIVLIAVLTSPSSGTVTTLPFLLQDTTIIKIIF